MKKLVAVLAVLFSLYGWSTLLSFSKVPEPAASPCFVVIESPLTEAQLKYIYLRYNEDYFLGQLPKDVPVKWADLRGRRAMGLTTCDSDGNGCTIQIDTNSNITEVTTESTILHEMCHVKLRRRKVLDHGVEFRGCVNDLIRQGAYGPLL